VTELDRELPEGYKMTELGPLPREWEVMKLGDVAYIKYGKSKPKDTGNIPVVGSGGIYSYTSKALIDYPTIIVGRKGTAGKAWLFLKPCYPSDTTFYLSWKKQVDVSFIFHYLTLHPLSGEHAKTTLPSLQKSELEEILIPLPPLPDQRKIAAVLSTVQEAKEKTEAVISAARDLKKSMMSYLFTYGPVPLPDAENIPQKETEIGMIPEEWEVVKLGDVADFKNGINFTANQKGDKGILTVDVLNMYGESIYVSLNNLYRVNKVIDKDYLLKEGDLLFVRSSLKREGIGWTSLFKPKDEPVTFCGFIIRARLKDKSILPEYITNYMRTDTARTNLVSSSGKVAITNINQGMLGNIKISLPPLPEQRKIASMLSAIDEKIEAEENKKKALEDLFNTLLHNLMTARIRVNHLALDKAELAM